jgi:hypothetical protein
MNHCHLNEHETNTYFLNLDSKIGYANERHDNKEHFLILSKRDMKFNI